MKHPVVLLGVILLIACSSLSFAGFDAFITMKDGYFFDPACNEPWVPHGIAYQTWNRPLGVWQTFDQIDYDLDEMVKMGANSIRVDFVWQHIEEEGDNQWKWENYDYLVQAAEARGIRIFALIGYQWPPNWFPDEWYTQHPPEYDASGIWHGDRWPSDIINYEHPEARAQYAEWFENVCGRYKDSKAIVGWIIGNESGYLGLWSGLLDGYDPESEQAFRTWCEEKYYSIENCNAVWGTDYESFSNIVFVEQYREYGSEGAQWADMVQWREDSIADFTALGAVAAKTADTNHLISYSTVGMQWGEENWRYHAEDRGKITRACRAANAPIDFFSVNNYPWSILGHESQNGHWGISYTKYVTKSDEDPEGVPVLYSETGFTSSETMWPGMNEDRQGPLIRNSLWESLVAGAVGTHIFAWHDRPYITDREKGFGLLYTDRNVKPAFWVSRDTFMLMEQVEISKLLSASHDPTPDIGFLWTAANDSQYNRYECEMQQIAGALERVGYEPNFIHLEDLAAGAYTNFKVLVLPRNMRVDSEVPGTGKGVMRFLRENVLASGIHLVASADLPGMQDENGNPLPDFAAEMSATFGVDVSDSSFWEVAPRTGNYIASNMVQISVVFSNAVSLTNGYTCTPQVWKYSDEVGVIDGSIWAHMDVGRNKGFEDSVTNVPRWGVWGDMEVRQWFPLDGTNHLRLMNDDSGIFQDFQTAPNGTYAFSTYLRCNGDDPLRGGREGSISIEWYDKDETLLGEVRSPALVGSTPGNSWVHYRVEGVAPTNAVTGRRVVRCEVTSNLVNLVANSALSGSGDEPDNWYGWENQNHDAEFATCRSASNSWAFWWNCGIWHDVTQGFFEGDTISFGGYLFTPSNDVLRNGKEGCISLEFRTLGGDLISTVAATSKLTSASTPDEWHLSQNTAVVPANAAIIRLLVYCNASGDGRFLADDIFVNVVSPGGSVYVDAPQKAPAMVVKDHGAAKAAIFLYSVGDNAPDGSGDGEMDILPWKWRYDIFDALVRDYFGVEPPLWVSGPNSHLCLADYRTCQDGSLLLQIKNYMYDRFHANGVGGDPLTFTINSPMFVGKTVRAFEQGRIVEKTCDGAFDLTLPPDGQEMVLVYEPIADELVCQISDAPAVIHPFGNKSYTVQVKYDTVGQENLVLKVALIGGAGEVVYQTVSTNVSGSGVETFWVWIPDADVSDPDYISTPEGGEYRFEAWLEDEFGGAVTAPAQQETQLKWGVAPDGELPTALTKGSEVNVPVKWEELYEYLYWQHCPLARNESFPSRVAVYRSSKTEAQCPGHFEQVNQVCDWLESMGYEPGNTLDIAFDNVMVTISVESAQSGVVSNFFDNMEAGTNGWTVTGLWHLAGDMSSSASNSWAYNNGANYDTGARTTGSLTSPWMQLGEGSIKLSFRSWYETEDTGTCWDRKVVSISTDGVNWTELLVVSGQNRTWTLQRIDLSSWAGENVKLRFSFDSMDGIYNSFRGWYVDDVMVTEEESVLVDLFNDDVEGGVNGWTAGGLWRLASDLQFGGTNSWAYNNGTDYNTGARNSGVLVSPWIQLTNSSRIELTFQSWHQTEDAGLAWDRKIVQISTDGVNWHQLKQISGTSGQWVRHSIDLTVYAGQNVRMRFFFDTIDSIANNYRGWYIDDVRITAQVQTEESSGWAAFADSMDSGVNNGWIASGSWRLASDLFASPSYSWAYNNGVNYATGSRTYGELVSPWIDLRTAVSASLSFKSWYETEDTGTSWDRKLVYITTNGAQWKQVMAISGLNRHWTLQSAVLDEYVGQQIRVKFVFDSVDSVFNNYRGWYIDDVRVTMTASGLLFFDNFAGNLESWNRSAGGANWTLSDGTLRGARIGNDDNILSVNGGLAWSNYTVQADFRYNKQGPYFNSAELYARYVDRNNFVKVLVQDFHGFWRLKYMVRVDTNNIDQGWIHEFSKANKPVEDTWYNLKVDVNGTNYVVYFDGEEVGSFSAPAEFSYDSTAIAVGSCAKQLGIWEPQRGYFLIDDDEYSYYSSDNQNGTSRGSPLNLDWGYLKTFFGTLILPGVYVMSDVETSNVATWVNGGTYSLIATDGGVGMYDENGDPAMGRLEDVFGVAATLVELPSAEGVCIGTNDHYVTLDYEAGDEIAFSGPAAAWTTVNNGTALGVSGSGHPAFICNKTGADERSPSKVFCFNLAADKQNALTGSLATVAQRAFEWCRGQASKVLLQLKYPNPQGADLDFVLAEKTMWLLGGSGATNISLAIPSTGIMTGTNLYWSMYAYPWDSDDPWADHNGFYTSSTDNMPVSIPGLGLQILGGPTEVFGGRPWDLWLGYNTLDSQMTLTYGIKEKGDLRNLDDFGAGVMEGWTVSPHSNITWSVTTANVLRASMAGTNGTSFALRDGLDIADRNITIEYNVKFGYPCNDGGILYRGQPIHVAWSGIKVGTRVVNSDINSYGVWNTVRVNIRDGDPYPRMDVYVNGETRVLAEPLSFTQWVGNTIGLLSPSYYYGAGPAYSYSEWDNFRVEDEHYSFAKESVSGAYMPTSDVPRFLPFIPNYDPDMWEFEGTTLGGEYEWYAYLVGENEYSTDDLAIRFAPRLMVESTNFPTNMVAGETVTVPVEWERLPEVPMTLTLQLVEIYSGQEHAFGQYLLTEAAGSGEFSITVSSNAFTADTYLWGSFIAATNSPDPLTERLGLDDTFRFNTDGLPVGPETRIVVTNTTPLTEHLVVYDDNGGLIGCSIYTWDSYREWSVGTAEATMNGSYTGVAGIPEGEKCFLTMTDNGNTYAGWGFFHTSSVDLTEYDVLKFWVKTAYSLEVGVESGFTKRIVQISSYGWDGTDTWQEITIPKSAFPDINWAAVKCPMKATLVGAGRTSCIDYVRWEKSE